MVFPAETIYEVLQWAALVGGALVLYRKAEQNIHEKEKISNRLDVHERDIAEIRDKVDKTSECIVEIKLALKTIQSDIIHIKEHMK